MKQRIIRGAAPASMKGSKLRVTKGNRQIRNFAMEKCVMTKETISRARLILNGLGCIVVIIFSLLIGLAGIGSTASTSAPVAGDPDAGKGQAVGMAGIALGGVLGLAAFVSLVRTVRKLREKPDGDRFTPTQ